MKKLLLGLILLLSTATVHGQEATHDLDECLDRADELGEGYKAKNEYLRGCFTKFKSQITFRQCRTIAHEMIGVDAPNDQRWECFYHFKNKGTLTTKQCVVLVNEMLGPDAQDDMMDECVKCQDVESC